MSFVENTDARKLMSDFWKEQMETSKLLKKIDTNNKITEQRIINIFEEFGFIRKEIERQRVINNIALACIGNVCIGISLSLWLK